MSKSNNRRKDLAYTILVCTLLLLCVTRVPSLLKRYGATGLDLSGRALSSIDEQTVSYLKEQTIPVLLTFFVSGRDAMPSRLKHVEEDVVAVLRAIEAAAPDVVQISIVDPDESGQDGKFYAARRGAAPFKVSEVLKDENDEAAVWSSLVVSRGGNRDVLIQGITSDDIPSLARLVVAHLKHQDKPVPPVIGVAAPTSFSLLRRLLSGEGHAVRDVAMDGAPVPGDVDVLFWASPDTMSNARIRALRRFLETGRSAVLAGSAAEILYGFEEGRPVFYRRPTPAWSQLLSAFGVRPQPDLLVDTSSGPVYVADSTGAAREVQAPFHLRVMPGYYTLKGFASHARGALNFVGASPIHADPGKVTEAGYRAEVIGTTTERASVVAVPNRPFKSSDLMDQIAVGKQPLMLRLVPQNDGWGELLVFASASPFRDGIINQPNFGHRVLLRTLLRTFSQPHRLLESRVQPPGPPDLGEIGGTSRVLWRVLVVVAVPVAVFAFGMCLGKARSRRRMGWPAAAFASAAVVVVAAGAGLWSLGAGLFIDVTEAGLHVPLPETEPALGPHREELRLTLIISHRASMPVSMKQLERSIQARLAGMGLSARVLRPEAVSPRDRARLGKLGLRSFPVRVVVDDEERTFSVWSGLRVSGHGRETVIPRIEPRQLDHLEFLVAAAVRRLAASSAPKVALIAPSPRLSPAESYEYIQQQLTPPRGSDVYSEVRRMLSDYGYDVAYVDPRDSRLPGDADVMLWFQPRRDAAHLLEQLSHHLAAGKPAVVAVQHFNIQQRQYRGAGFETVYWPQPQFQDLLRYTDSLGIEQVREVLMDRNRSHLLMETQVNRRAVREYEQQEVALPFLIRTVRDNYDPSRTMTAKLGDQLFIWGNRFTFDAERLGALGLEAHSLISTTGDAWAFEWKAGWLPPEVFDRSPAFGGPQALVAEVSGPFPTIRFARGEDGRVSTELAHATRGQRSARLVLIGSSEMFKNDELFRAGFEHDQLLLNVLADFAYDGDLATLQTRRSTNPGFKRPSFGTIAAWRTSVIGIGPAGLVVFGFVWMRYRRRVGRP